jgi:hypothetical protein
MPLLLAAALVGLAAGWLRARSQRRPYLTVTLRHPWLVFLAFLPQWLAFGLQATREHISTPWASAALISSQILLLIFVWFNRSHPAFWLLGLGLIFNFCVIVLNGGLMPISPETVHRLYPTALASEWQIGSRLGTGKDIVLAVEQTRLWFLSDRFLTPPVLNYQAAFSLGDVLIALGACWLLYAPGKAPEREGEVSWLLVSRKAN